MKEKKKYYAWRTDVETHDKCDASCDESFELYSEDALINSLATNEPAEVIEFTRGKVLKVVLRRGLEKTPIVEKVQKKSK